MRVCIENQIRLYIVICNLNIFYNVNKYVVPNDIFTEGSYAYFEANQGHLGFTAQLTSPPLTVPTGRTYCLSLWFYMYGEHVGDLSVYVQKNNNKNLIWKHSGNHGNVWIQGLVNIPASSQAKVRSLNYKCLE